MSSTYEKKLNHMLIEYPTTYQSDYMCNKFDPPHKIVHKPKPTPPKPKPRPTKDVQTLTFWKGKPIPFDLQIKRKDIIGSHPYQVQQVYTKPVHQDNMEVQRTRPRLIMTPALSLDDITDPHVRGILIDDIYTSVTTKDSREAVKPTYNVTAPLPYLPAPARPLVLPKLRQPMVSPEWRMESITWDNKQLRGYCNPARTFWLNMELPRCRLCDETETMKAHRNKEQQTAQKR